MSEIEELRRRLEALEARVEEVAEQQAATRHLAVNSDRDVAALQEQRRADMQLLQDLRTTQIEHGRTLKELGTTVGVLLTGQIELARVQDQHTETLAKHTETLDRHTETLDRLVTAVDAIAQRLGVAPPEQPREQG
jgi:chromosome segregation ATPase